LLKVGDIAPEIDATTSAGERFRLSDQEGLCTIVFFFPKAFTPGCTIETRRFRDNYAELALLGARIVGVSTDDHDTQCLFAKEMRTPFPMIGDGGKGIARAYGVLWPILERAMRVTFVVDAERRIAAVIHHELAIVQHRDEVLRVIDRMRGHKVDSAAPQAIAGIPFDLLAEAGAGGMGTVYMARQRSTGRIVALKVLGKNACPVRFAREVDVLARLEHPNIVGYIDHGTTQSGLTWLAMEWLEGTSLHELISSGPMPAKAAARIAADVARGLAAAHAAGVVHRDIKPSNVIVTRDGVVKIVDFGVALSREQTIDALTRTGQIVGTPGYMAPEQARADKTIDGRTDLFALGCLLHRCATGRRAFEGDDALALLHSVLTKTTPRMEGVPADLDALCVELLAKEMEDRPASASAVTQRLDAIVLAMEGPMDRTVPDGSPANLRTTPMPVK
jgi:peroxiredoxin